MQGGLNIPAALEQHVGCIAHWSRGDLGQHEVVMQPPLIPEAAESSIDVRYPVSHRPVEGLLQGARSCLPA
eukprot:scaffold11275_cov108-Isochrysis_galbana.AAC.10